MYPDILLTMLPVAHPIILGVRPDPEPEYPIGSVDGECSVMQTDAHRMKAPHSFEMERWMSRVSLQKLELSVRECTHRLRQCVIASPEARCRVVGQSLRERPARCSVSAASASRSSLPARASSSTWRSHSTASYATNHSRKLASSSADKFWTSRSSFPTLVIA